MIISGDKRIQYIKSSSLHGGGFSTILLLCLSNDIYRSDILIDIL